MSRLAQDRDVPLETLMVEAFDDVLTKHKKPLWLSAASRSSGDN